MAGGYALVAAAALAAAAAAAQGYSAHQQTKANQYQAELDADILDYNARVTRAETAQQENTVRRRARILLSEQRSRASSRGLSLAGSAWDLYMQSAAEAELDALEVRRQGEMRVRDLAHRSNQQRYAAGAHELSARIGIGVTALETASAGLGTYASGGGFNPQQGGDPGAGQTGADASDLEVD